MTVKVFKEKFRLMHSQSHEYYHDGKLNKIKICTRLGMYSVFEQKLTEKNMEREQSRV